MILYWHGKNCVSLENSSNVLMVDPLDLDKELKSAKASDVVLLADRSNKVKIPSKTTSFVVTNPGEYDVKGFFILGFGDFGSSTSLDTARDKSLGSSNNIAYVIEAENIKICYLTGLDKELTDAQLETLPDVDVLLIDVGAGEDANEIASKIVNQIEPRIVVPIGYDPAKKPSTFLKEMGASEIEPQNKLNIKKKDLPQEETKLVVLNALK